MEFGGALSYHAIMQNLKASLDASISRWNLLTHPFYRAWSEGTLPVTKLQRYAAEYGGFINTIAANWRTAGEEVIANEEETHFAMWNDFAHTLGAPEIQATLPETKALVERSRTAAALPATALSALYAFEAQQPHTTASKHEGLHRFYPHLSIDDTYFRVHMNEDHEAAILLRKMEALPLAAQETALVACEAMSQALWDALSGIDATS